MKNHIQLMAVFAVFLILMPCVTFFSKKDGQAQANADYPQDTVKFLFTQQNEVAELSMEDYMIGAVLAQTPADFEEETLKAQAVLAHTYALRRSLNEQLSPTDGLKGAIMSDEIAVYQNYFTEAQAKELYGDDYQTAYDKISKAVKAVENDVLVYDGEPITVAFHAISSGKTESAENAWGEKIPYLISCDSSWDAEISGYTKETEFTADELTARISSTFPEAEITDVEADDLITVEETTDAGTVLSVRLGESFFVTGQQLAQTLSLPSPCFSIDCSDSKFTFTTKGYGHLVGLSQYGANSLAKQGKSYKEILAHYFPGTKIVSQEK
ncbi:MAG: stage II sporulation protein D [Oscillospiraceae bacterium]